MPINGKAEAFWSACMASPGGATTIHLDESEVAAFDGDPDGYAAKYFGLSLQDYYEWVHLDGTPLCGETTKSGALCKVPCGRTQLGPSEWSERHRNEVCGTHAKLAGRPQ